MKAYINENFLILFLYENEIDDGCASVDYDCLVEWNIDDEVEILKEIKKGSYAKNQKSYVVYNPRTHESVTVAEEFLRFI
jgi:hypothetical protein